MGGGMRGWAGRLMGGREDEGMHGRVGALEDAMMVVIDVSMSAAFIMDPYGYIDTCIDAGCIDVCIEVGWIDICSDASCMDACFDMCRCCWLC